MGRLIKIENTYIHTNNIVSISDIRRADGYAKFIIGQVDGSKHTVIKEDKEHLIPKLIEMRNTVIEEWAELHKWENTIVTI